MVVDPLKQAMNRAYQFCEEQQRALDEGRITEAEWFEIHQRYFTAHYLAGDNPRAQSGHGSDATAYRYARGMVLEAIDRSGTLIDIGCANGHLIEMLDRWLQGTGLTVEMHGLDISEGLLALARRRLPHWESRLYLGNALYWTPSQPFDHVLIAGCEYVPRDRERDLFEHLYADIVAPGGRLILGPTSEAVEHPELEGKLRRWGYAPSGYCVKSHQHHAALCRRLFWFDKT
ncbi:MAG: class I SAM-dependent methyltransferase [Anaerolineae bacterium]|nr:class I SAM-dependent methyltransferase [Anaerolineae bacterium]